MQLRAWLCFVLLLWPLSAIAAPSRQAPVSSAAPGRAGSARAGALLLEPDVDGAEDGDDEDDDGTDGVLAPLLTSHIAVHVDGLIARTRVVQAFDNASDATVHATYVFPLPDAAAVDGLVLSVGRRRLVGEVREDAAAERAYANAKRRGQKASLIEEQRPGVFATHLANIAPHEVVRVELSYAQVVHYEAGRFSLDVPGTFTPRHMPGGPDSDVESYQRDRLKGIAPPLADDGDAATWDLHVSLDAGLPLARVESPTHAVLVTKPRGHGTTEVSLQEGEVLADRDFRLEWTPARNDAVQSMAWAEESHGRRYLLSLLVPPAARCSGGVHAKLPACSDQTPGGRDTWFLLDASESMSGAPLEQARAVLRSALGALAPADRFNVVVLQGRTRALFDASVSATPERVQHALDGLAKVQPRGGTDLKSGLELAALAPAGAPNQAAQIVLISDGAVAGEAELVRFLQTRLRGHRLFTVAVGAAPNEPFLRRAARLGGGTFTSVTSARGEDARSSELWTQLSGAPMSGLGLVVTGNAAAETWPDRLPDLFPGQALVVATKLGAKSDGGGRTAPLAAADTPLGIQLQGERGGLAFSLELPLGNVAAAAPRTHRAGLGIAQLWAQFEIESLLDRAALGQSLAELRPRATTLALSRHLLSPYTELVAIDSVRSVEEPGIEVEVPNALPAGSEMFGKALPSSGPTCFYGGLEQTPAPGK
jgi:Ca-activated chloride channel family protein